MAVICGVTSLEKDYIIMQELLTYVHTVVIAAKDHIAALLRLRVCLQKQYGDSNEETNRNPNAGEIVYLY